MTEFDVVLHAIQARAWYPLAAALLTVLIGLWRKLQPNVWSRIPTRWQWLPAVLVAGGGGFIDAASHGATWVFAVVTAVYAMLSGGVTAIGLAHTAKRVSGSVNTAGSVGTVALVLIAALGLGGCAAFRTTVRDVSYVAHDLCESVLAQRAEVRAQAERQGISPLDVARALCAINDVVRPFVAGAEHAGDQAVGAAHRMGALRR